jgi:hypothetical protein
MMAPMESTSFTHNNNNHNKPAIPTTTTFGGGGGGGTLEQKVRQRTPKEVVRTRDQSSKTKPTDQQVIFIFYLSIAIFKVLNE